MVLQRHAVLGRALIGLALLGTAACAESAPFVSAGAASPNGTSEAPNGTTGGTEPGTGEPSVGSLDWSEIGEGVEEANLTVPLDYADPQGATVSLYVVRRLADDPSKRIGSLLVNPGGPGFGGSFLAEQADFIYGADLLERFDIVGWDPRGTGLSSPAVDCIDDYDPYFGVDSSPDDAAELTELTELGKRLAEACAAENPDILAHVSTAASAQDMDSLRRALGEDEISYFGFSYGSELGATWVTMFPETVRAAVLDGAVDPNQESIDAVLAQAKGFESTLTTFLARCSEDADCAFNNDGDAEGAFDRLIAAIDAQPLATSNDRTPATSGVALTGVTQAMYTEALWPELEQALADAQQGDGDGLLALYDAYYQRQPDGSYGNELEAFVAIECVDDPGPLTIEEIESHRADYVAAAPRLGDHFLSTYTCVYWPVAQAPKVIVTGAGAGPVVVVGTTGDAATPLSSTEAMAKALEEGHLVVVDAEQHTGYGVNSCINSAVDDYLVELAIPEAGLRC